PAVILLILTIFWPLLTRRRMSTFDLNIDTTRTGLSLAVITMGLIGLTVHFWDAPWLFLNLCIGVRVSLAEYERGLQASLARSGDLRSMNLALALRRRS